MRRGFTACLCSASAACGMMTGGFGCVQPLNERLTLGGVVAPPAIGGHAQQADKPRNTETGFASLSPGDGVDRDSWPPVVYIAYWDGVVSGPVYRGTLQRSRWTYDREQPGRRYGLAPDAESALTPTMLDPALARREGFFAPLIAFGEIALMPVRMLQAPSRTPRSPVDVYKRTEQADRWHLGYAAPGPDDVTTQRGHGRATDAHAEPAEANEPAAAR